MSPGWVLEVPFRGFRSETQVLMGPSLKLALGFSVEAVSVLVVTLLLGHWLSLSTSPPTSFVTRAAPATRHSPHPVASSSKTHWDSRGPSSLHPPKCLQLPGFLSWFPQRSPLHRHPPGASTLGYPRLKSCHTLKHVPSLSFLTTSTVCSALSFAGLLHPATDHEVRLVLSRLLTSPPIIRPSPQALVPFEAFPSLAADLPVTRAPSLSPLASRSPK